MIKINRQENPTFVKYNEAVVISSLKNDFFKKCYLCEEITPRHYEVDHFYPQVSHAHLINEYSNLFYICQKCNKIKPKKTNTKIANEILNCCDIEVEEYIKLKLNMKKCEVEVEQIAHHPTLENEIKNTIELLHRIYNGKKSQSNACEDLKDEIKASIASFRQYLDKYKKTKLKRAIIEKIKNDLHNRSSYSTFKRWIVRDSLYFNKIFGKYIRELK